MVILPSKGLLLMLNYSGIPVKAARLKEFRMIKVITRNAKGHVTDFLLESILELNSFTES